MTTLAQTLDDAGAKVQRLEGSAAVLAASLAARHLSVDADLLFKPNLDRTSEMGKRVDMARAVAVWLLSCGLGWSQPRAGAPFNMSQASVSKAVRRLADAEDVTPGLSDFLQSVENLLAERAG